MANVKVDQSVFDKVAAILAETSPDFITTGKILNKGIEADAKLSAFLLQAKTKQFKLKGMGLFSDPTRLEARVESIIGDVGSGFTSIDQKRAQVITLMGADLNAVVGAKHLEVTNNGSTILSEAQKSELSDALLAYKSFLVNQVKPVINRFAVTIGAAKIVETPVVAKAVEAAVEVVE